MKQLSGRTCLVTGASSGLGAHFARLVAGAGARVVVAARRRDRVAALADELCAQGGEAVAVAMDVADEASVIAGYDAAEQAFGPVDTIIANAGVSATGRSTEVAVEKLHAVLDTNVLGVMLTAREGARRLLAAGGPSGRGRIVMIGSIAAAAILPGEALYCASKAAVAQLGRSLAKEWVRAGINVNVIQPGFIDSEMTRDWFASERGQAQMAGFNRRRLQPIASLDAPLLYLCSDASANTTGATFTIDDGQAL